MAFHLAREKKNHHVSILGGQKYTRHINSRLQPIPLAKTSPRDSKLIHTGSLKTSSCLRQTFPCPKQIVRQFLQSPSSMAFSQPPYSLVSPAHCPNYCLQKGTAPSFLLSPEQPCGFHRALSGLPSTEGLFLNDSTASLLCSVPPELLSPTQPLLSTEPSVPSHWRSVT